MGKSAVSDSAFCPLMHFHQTKAATILGFRASSSFLFSVSRFVLVYAGYGDWHLNARINQKDSILRFNKLIFMLDKGNF